MRKQGTEFLTEIVPIQKSKRQTRLITYKRVKRKIIRKAKIEDIWDLLNAQEKPIILEDRRFLHFQYPGKPIIILKKVDGRLYTIGNETTWIKHQAGLILRMLNDFGLVTGFVRKTVSKPGLKLVSP